MRAPTGNMANVYAEFWRMQEIADEVEPEMNRFVSEAKMTDAQIIPGAPATWHVVVPANIGIACKHLERRRFGIYQPMLAHKIIRRGRVVTTREQLFPGYIFVFVFGVENQWQRIRHCPGVARMIMQQDRPAIMPDRLIHELQWKEAISDAQVEKRQRYRKKWQKVREALDPWHPNVSTKSFWADVERLDSPARIGLLQQALSLPS